MLSASGSQGTTTYSYAAKTGSVQDNALTSITNPDGTHQYFTYDTEGLLTTQSVDNGAGLQTYSYPSTGEVTVTNAAGNLTTLLYGANDSVAQIQDTLGNATQLGSNSAGELTSLTTAGNNVYRYAYDAAGNLTSYTDPLGGTVNASYASGTQNLTTFNNQLGTLATLFTVPRKKAGHVASRRGTGNGTSYRITWPAFWSAATDADGNTIRYGYDAAGNLVSKTYADGTSDTYAYGSHGNLILGNSPGRRDHDLHLRFLIEPTDPRNKPTGTNRELHLQYTSGQHWRCAPSPAAS